MKRLLLLVVIVLLVVGCSNGDSGSDGITPIPPMKDITSVLDFIDDYNATASEFGFPYRYDKEAHQEINPDEWKEGRGKKVSLTHTTDDAPSYSYINLHFNEDGYAYEIQVGHDWFNQEEYKEQFLEDAFANIETVIGVISPSLDESERKDLIEEIGITEETLLYDREESTDVYGKVFVGDYRYEFRTRDRSPYSAELVIGNKDQPYDLLPDVE